MVIRRSANLLKLDTLVSYRERPRSWFSFYCRHGRRKTV